MRKVIRKKPRTVEIAHKVSHGKILKIANSVNASLGKGTVSTTGNVARTAVSNVKFVSTLMPTFDDILSGNPLNGIINISGTGRGFPRGRVIEIYGPESSGKTTLALHAISAVQRQGGVAAFVDAEHALDLEYVSRCLNVDVESMLMSQPDSGEQALEIVEVLARAGVDLIVVDSVAALVPQKEIEGDYGDAQMGLQARLMSQAMRKLTPVIARSGSIVIFINQIRKKIGVFFGNPETTSGGNALKFYASIRIETRVTKQIKTNGKTCGQFVRVKVVKNKVAPPHREAMFTLKHGQGFRPAKMVSKAKNMTEAGSGAWE